MTRSALAATGRLSCFLAALALPLATACVSGGPEGASWDDRGPADGFGKAYHPDGRPTNGPEAFQWYAATDDDVLAYRDTVLPGRHGLLPADHPVTARLQRYVDAMDDYARAVSPTAMTATPRPSVRVYTDPDFLNAWASGVPVCIDAPVVFEGDPGADPAEEHHSVLLHHASVRPLAATRFVFGRRPLPLEDCIEADLSSDLEGFVAWMNGRGGPCRYSLVDGAIHVGNANDRRCRVEGGATGSFTAPTARYYAVIPQVFVSSGYIDFIEDEAMVVAVLAHELGHYYKSHATNAEFALSASDQDQGGDGAPPAVDVFEASGEASYASDRGGYNYFYTQLPRSEARTPPPRADSDEIRRLVLLYSLDQDNPLKLVDGARLDPTVGRLVLSLVYGDALECPRATELYYEHALFNLWRGTELDAAARRAYLEIEEAFLGCGERVTVGPGAGGLPVESLVRAFTPQMAAHLEGVDIGPELEGRTLSQAVLDLSDRMVSYSEAAEEFHELLVAERIGYYTAEQEADELGAELLAAIGLPPMAHALLDLHGGRYREAEAPDMFRQVNGLTMARCQELFDAGFVDPATGEQVFVPIGDLSGIHHGPCYRAFNIHREVEAHGYEPVPRDWAFEESWGAVLDMVRALNGR